MSCKVQFPAGVQDNVTLNNSEKLAQATILDIDGNPSSLWNDMTSKVPVFENLENTFTTFANVYERGLENKGFETNPESREPKLFFQSTNGKIFESYKDALQDSSSEGNVSFGFKRKNSLYPIGHVTTSINPNTREGLINGGIKDGLLSGETIADSNGKLFLKPEGGTQTEQMLNVSMFRKQVEYNNLDYTQEYKNGTVHVSNNVLTTGVEDGKGNLITPQDVLENFNDFAERTSNKEAADVVVDELLRNGEYDKVLAGFENLQVEGNKELATRLFEIINQSGITLMSIENYNKRYAEIHGQEMDAVALADVANGIIALSEGATLEDLAEEVSHFVVEGMLEQEIDTLVNSEEFLNSKEYNDNYQTYKDIYERQGYEGKELERKVQKEILGKMLASGILTRYQSAINTDQNAEPGFLENLKNFVDKLVAKIKSMLPNNMSALEQWQSDLSDKLLNDRVESILNLKEIQSKNKDTLNPVFYATNSNKIALATLKDTLDALEGRLQRIRRANISDVEAYNYEVRRAIQAVEAQNEKLAIHTLVTIAESMANKTASDIKRLTSGHKGIRNEHLLADIRIMETQMIPALQELQASFDTFGIDGAEKANLDRIISVVETIASDNKRKSIKVTTTNAEQQVKELLKKYNIPEEAYFHIAKSLFGRQADISQLYAMFGNPEHSQHYAIGMLGKIIANNGIKARALMNKYAGGIINVLDKFKVTSDDQKLLIERTNDGADTGNFISHINTAEAEKAYYTALLDAYNQVKHGTDKDSYKTMEEFESEGYIFKDLSDTEQIQYNEEKIKVDQEYLNTRYTTDVYNKMNAVYKALGMGQEALDFLRSNSARRHDLLKKIMDSDGNIKLEALKSSKFVLQDLQLLANEKAAVTSLTNPLTGEVYGTVNESKLRDITYTYEDANGKQVTESFKIPTIELASGVDINDSSVKRAVDLVNMNLFNVARFQNETRTINDNYLNEVSRIEDSIAQKYGYKDFATFEKSSRANKSAIYKEINETLLDFVQITGGLSFSESFYANLSTEQTAPYKQKLDEIINDTDDDLVKDTAEKLKTLMTRRANLLKIHRNKLNFAEIDGDEMSDVDRKHIRDLDADIKTLKRELAGMVDEDLNGKLREDFSSYEMNSSFEQELKDSGKNKLDFMVQNSINPAKYQAIRQTFTKALTEGKLRGGKDIINFLEEQGVLDNGRLTPAYANILSDQAAIEELASKYMVRNMPSYYTRFTPKGYDAWKRLIDQKIYHTNGKQSSFGNFLRNAVAEKRATNPKFEHAVEQYITINPSLQYTDGNGKTFKEQINEDFDSDSPFGGRQFKTEKFINEKFFQTFTEIDRDAYLKMNDTERWEYMQNLAEKTNDGKFALYVEALKANKQAYENYGLGSKYSIFRRPRFRKNTVESVGQTLTSPKDAVVGWFNKSFKQDASKQDEGAFQDGVNLTLGTDYKTMPKRGIHNFEDMNDLTEDVASAALQFLHHSSDYLVKEETLDDAMMLGSLIDSQVFKGNLKGKESQVKKMYKSFVDSHWYGIKKVGKFELFGMDISRVVMWLSDFIGKVNTSWSLWVAATGNTSGNVFALSEAVASQYYDTDDWKRAFGTSFVSTGKNAAETGKAKRTNKMYLTLRALGVQGYGIEETNYATGHNRAIQSLLNEPAYKLADSVTEQNRHLFGATMLLATKLYKGRWMSKAQFEMVRRREGADNASIRAEYKTLPSLYDNYNVSENGDLTISEQGKKLALEQLEKLHPGVEQSKLEAMLDNDAQVFLDLGTRLVSLQTNLEGTVAQEQKSAASRHWLGKAFLVNRNWFFNKMQRDFKATHFNYITGQYEGGGLVSAIRTLRNFGNKFRKVVAASSDLDLLTISQKELINDPNISDADRAAMIQHFQQLNKKQGIQKGFEILLHFVLAGIGAMLLAGFASDDEDKENWMLQSLLYVYLRTVSELGSTQIHTGGPQALEMMKTPTMIMNPFVDLFKSLSFDEVSSGTYKGWPKIVQWFIKYSPARQWFMHEDPFRSMSTYAFHNSASLGLANFKRAKDFEALVDDEDDYDYDEE